MSFGFSIGDFLAIIKLANEVRKDFAGAPKQFHAISSEVRNLSIILQDVDTLLAEGDIPETQTNNLSDITSSCHSVLHDTQHILNKYCDLEPRDKSFGNTVKRAWKRLTWEPDDIRELRSRIMTNITLLNSFLEGHTRDNVAKLVKQQDRQENLDVLDWLTPIDYAAQQTDFIRRRQPGTGQWLLDSLEYQKWLTTKKEILYCPGIPGAGKTILVSIVVDNLVNSFSADSSVAVCYLYCNFRRTEEQTPENMMLSLLKQMVQGQNSLPGSVKDLYDRHKGRRTRPSTDEVRKALHSVATNYCRAFIVVDALDECQQLDGFRSKFIFELLTLHSKVEVNILVTSRFIPEISEKFREYTWKEIRAIDEDISRYLVGNLSNLPGFVLSNLKLQTEINESIMECVDGMFLLAQLHLDSLRGKRSPKALRNALAKLVKGSDAYDSAYHDAMERIQGQLADQKELAMQALTWITYAKRPLTTLELRHALGVELNEPAIDEENLPDLQDLVSNCCGLVTVDEESDIVRLVHYTTQEYFERTKNNWFPNAQLELTNICMTYLMFQAFEKGMCTNDSEFNRRLSSHPLYDYASHHWGDHARHCSNCAAVPAFLSSQSRVQAATQALLVDGRWSSQHFPRRMNGLHLAAFFGVSGNFIVKETIQTLDKRDSDGRTPILYAAGNGHITVVQLFLENGAEIDSKDNLNRTPLWHAVFKRYEEIVRLLLDNRAKIDSKNNLD